MAWFWKKSWDWCHICGTRQDNCVEISYPSNAEHQFVGENGSSSERRQRKVCQAAADCGETVVRIGRGELEIAVRTIRPLSRDTSRASAPYPSPTITDAAPRLAEDHRQAEA